MASVLPSFSGLPANPTASLDITGECEICNEENLTLYPLMHRVNFNCDWHKSKRFCSVCLQLLERQPECGNCREDTSTPAHNTLPLSNRGIQKKSPDRYYTIFKIFACSALLIAGICLFLF